MSVPLIKAIKLLLDKLQQVDKQPKTQAKKPNKTKKQKKTSRKKAAWFITTCKTCGRTYDYGHFYHNCQKKEVSEGKFVWIRRDVLRRNMTETIDTEQSLVCEPSEGQQYDAVELINEAKV